jgi:predicted dehydrogenase
MVEAHEKAGTTLTVVSQHRYRNSPVAAKGLIDSGAIGEVRMVRVTGLDGWWDMAETQDEWKLDHEQMRVYADWGAHGCDVLRWFVGSPAVRAYAEYHTYSGAPPPGQSVLATYRFASGVMASVWMTYEVPEPRLGSALQLLVTGSEGLIDVDAYGAVRLGRDGGWTTVYEQPPFDPLDPMSVGRLEAYRRELDDVVRAVETGVPALVDGREGLATQRMLDAVETCARTGLPVYLIEED